MGDKPYIFSTSYPPPPPYCQPTRFGNTNSPGFYLGKCIFTCVNVHTSLSGQPKASPVHGFLIPHREAHEKPASRPDEAPQGAETGLLVLSLATCAPENFLETQASVPWLNLFPLWKLLETLHLATPRGLSSGRLRHDRKRPSCMVTGWVKNFILEPVATEIRCPPLSPLTSFVFSLTLTDVNLYY